MSCAGMCEAFNLEIPTNQKFVAVVLGDCADADGNSLINIKSISKATTLSERNVEKALDWLLKNGLIVPSFNDLGDKCVKLTFIPDEELQ